MIQGSARVDLQLAQTGGNEQIVDQPEARIMTLDAA